MTITDQTTLAGELVDRARALVPVLAERRKETLSRRRVLPETIDDLRQAGLLKVLQAERNGGYAQSIRTHLDVVSTLAEGCGSTSWVVGVVHAHSFVLSHFPQEAQDETYGADPDAVICAVLAPRGTAKKVPGGYVLNGTWPFASGSENSQWLFFGARLLDDDGNQVDTGQFLIPTSDGNIRDDWYVTGLVGTGSCTVDVKDVFVPEHRFLSMSAVATGETPGIGLHSGHQHLTNIGGVLAIALAPTAVGLGRRILSEVPAQLAGKVIGYSQTKTLDHALTHLKLAEAEAWVDEAEFHLHRAADVLDRAAAEGTAYTAMDRARLRADLSHTVDLSLRAAESLRTLLGGSGLGATNPVQVALADLRAMSVHAGLARDPGIEDYGRMMVGLESMRMFR